jgi:hypothetical protein
MVGDDTALRLVGVQNEEQEVRVGREARECVRKQLAGANR